MKARFLLPNRFKAIGWVVLLTSTALWAYVSIMDKKFSFLQANTFAFVGSEVFEETRYFSLVNVNLTFTVIGALFIIGGLIVCFSREKVEDEYIMKLRLSSFQWAVLINYVFLLFAFFFVFGPDFLAVMLYNMFSVLVLFIIRFNYLLLTGRDYEK